MAGLDNDIATKVQGCQVCQLHQSAPPQAPLYPWEWPSWPWARLHIDHAGPFLGKLYLIVVDAHRLEASIVNSTSAECTIAHLRKLFMTHGIPEQIVSDNGARFTSEEFKQFTRRNGIKHIFMGMLIRWTGAREWSTGMEHWNGLLEWSTGACCTFISSNQRISFFILFIAQWYF